MDVIKSVTELIENAGMSIVLMGYFLVKDWKFNQQILDTLGAINTVLTKLDTWHAKDGDTE